MKAFRLIEFQPDNAVFWLVSKTIFLLAADHLILP